MNRGWCMQDYLTFWSRKWAFCLGHWWAPPYSGGSSDMAAVLRNLAAKLGGRTTLQAANVPGRLPARLIRTRPITEELKDAAPGKPLVMTWTQKLAKFLPCKPMVILCLSAMRTEQDSTESSQSRVLLVLSSKPSTDGNAACISVGSGCQIQKVSDKFILPTQQVGSFTYDLARLQVMAVAGALDSDRSGNIYSSYRENTEDFSERGSRTRQLTLNLKFEMAGFVSNVHA